METPISNTIKGYELRERIGAGGFGAVYRAYQSTIGREVAIKIILSHFASQPDFIRRFETEAQLVARLEHPYIIPLYDYWRDPTGAYLVMRWLKGGSLRDALQKGPFELEAAALVVDQSTTAALATAHRGNVIHRDLKPGNILLDEDSNAYLADFGIAKDLGSVQPAATEIDAIVGSPDYLAPEQAHSEIVTPRTDIYSFGVVLYELLTGEHPFPQHSMVERLYKHLNDPLPAITTVPEDVREAVNAVIQKATAKNPAQRYADILELAAAFRQAIRRTDSTTVVETLTLREQDILQRIIAGQSNRQISADLFMTVGTVKWYITQIYRKLGVRSRVQAMVRARDLNLLGGQEAPVLPVPLPTEEFHPENPYKGLRAFTPADHQDYFGREKLTTRLVKRLSENGDYARFLAVVGPSGSGKSSLVKAGLIPALWRGELPGSEKWFIIEILPGTQPLDELEIALTKIAANHGENIRDQLERDERGLARIASLILPNDGSELLVVIDQFEEVFTLVESEPARMHLLDLLYYAVTAPRSRVRVVVTLRADFYDRPLQYGQFGELVRNRLETVLPLTAEELERAISSPAMRMGVTFEPGLVASVVADVNYQPGALPLLQYALTELFEQRQGRLLTREAYHAIGKTTGALAKRAEEIFLGLNEADQEIARQMFLRLVTPGDGTEDTRRRVNRSELLAMTAEADVMDEIIDTYAEYRLLSLDNDPGTRTPTVEVAHEALLREWERLRAWLNESREDIRQERVLAQAAYDWDFHARDASYLLSGSRLEVMSAWRETTGLVLTRLEREFIDASIVERDTRKALDEERKAREAALERRSYIQMRALVGVFAGATVIVAIFSAFLGLALNDVATERDNARRISLAAQAQIALDNGQPAEIAALLALHSLKTGYSPEADAALLTAVQRGFALTEYAGHSDALRQVLTSADELRVFTYSEDQTARLWDTQTGEELRQVNHGSLITSGWISPDGRLVTTAGGDGMVRVWEVATGAQKFELNHGAGFVWTGVFSPDSKYIPSADNSDTVRIWSTETGEQIQSFASPGSRFGMNMFTPDGRYILGAGSDVVLWDVQTGKIIRRFFGHTGFVIHADISPDGLRLVTGSQDGSARLWDITTGQEIRRVDAHTGTVGGTRFSPDGTLLLTGSDDGTARIWNVETGEELRRFNLRGFVYAVAFLPDGQHILTAGSDRTARLWSLNDSDEPHMFIEAFLGSKRGELSLDSRMLADNTVLTSGANGGLHFWKQSDTGYILEREVMYGHDLINAIAYHPGSGVVVTAIGDGVVKLWDATSGAQRYELTGHEGTVWDVAFSPDGRRVLTAGNDGTARLWDTQTGEQLFLLNGHDDPVQAAVFSADGRLIATAGSDFSARLWDATTGQALQQLHGHTAAVRGVAFSPDGQFLVTVSNDTTALLWNVATGELVRRFNGHTDQIWRVAFSPDGRFIVTGSADLTARVWDVETGATVRQLVGHRNSVQSVAYSPDGSHIITGDDQASYLWLADLDKVIELACSRLPRDFTDAERSLYRIEANSSGCATGVEPGQAASAAWTPHPPLPTALPVVLVPAGEETISEFDFFSLPKVFVEGMHVPAADVHIQSGTREVVRPTILDAAALAQPLYATTRHVPMDFIVPPYDAGPYEQGWPLGFTLGEWMQATGHAVYRVGADGASLSLEFTQLVPRGLYTVWCSRVNLPEASITDTPCGDPDGANNSFTADEAGSAAIRIALNEVLRPSTEDIRTVISIAYHSDGQTYGHHFGELGATTHQQLVYEFPFE